MPTSHMAKRSLPTDRAPEAGFTLVEMLIALAIFAIIAGGALSLLRFSVDAEIASRTRTEQIAATRRFLRKDARVVLTVTPSRGAPEVPPPQRPPSPAPPAAPGAPAPAAQTQPPAADRPTPPANGAAR